MEPFGMKVARARVDRENAPAAAACGALGIPLAVHWRFPMKLHNGRYNQHFLHDISSLSGT